MYDWRKKVVIQLQLALNVFRNYYLHILNSVYTYILIYILIYSTISDVSIDKECHLGVEISLMVLNGVFFGCKMLPFWSKGFCEPGRRCIIFSQIYPARLTINHSFVYTQIVIYIICIILILI